MDNGLIFPYRRMNVRAEAGDAKIGSFSDPFGVMLGDPSIQAGSRQAAE